MKMSLCKLSQKVGSDDSWLCLTGNIILFGYQASSDLAT